VILSILSKTVPQLMHGIVMVSVDGKSVLGEEFVIFLIVAEPVCQIEIFRLPVPPAAVRLQSDFH
jgi:hypothetical protein